MRVCVLGTSEILQSIANFRNLSICQSLVSAGASNRRIVCCCVYYQTFRKHLENIMQHFSELIAIIYRIIIYNLCGYSVCFQFKIRVCMSLSLSLSLSLSHNRNDLQKGFANVCLRMCVCVHQFTGVSNTCASIRRPPSSPSIHTLQKHRSTFLSLSPCFSGGAFACRTMMRTQMVPNSSSSSNNSPRSTPRWRRWAASTSR